MGRPSPIVIPTAIDRRPRAERTFARALGAEPVRASTAGAVVDIYDEIGFGGVTAKAVRDRLDGLAGRNITLRVNSPGGSVTESIAIFNDLSAYRGRIRAEVSGIAASGASLLLMAADHIAVAANAFVMAHESWGLTLGNKRDHEQQIDVLRKIDRGMEATYAARTGLTVERVHDLMAAETWMTADEAKELGFADEVIGEVQPQACFDLANVYNRVPDALKALSHTGQDRGPRRLDSRADLERLLRAGGLSDRAARKVAAGGFGALSGDDDDAITQTLHARLAAAAEELRSLRTE